jgi:hypothetical protein
MSRRKGDGSFGYEVILMPWKELLDLFFIFPDIHKNTDNNHCYEGEGHKDHRHHDSDRFADRRLQVLRSSWSPRSS